MVALACKASFPFRWLLDRSVSLVDRRCHLLTLLQPYLLSLGFSKPLMALVWIAGPLAGVIGQPYFGLCSDQTRIQWGKRKPFIFIGAMVIIWSLMGLAWTRDIVCIVAWILGAPMDSDAIQYGVLTAAAIFVWIMNFAVQPLQAGLRALIIDSCPPDHLNVANAWASRMISMGALVGYGSGFLDLPRLLHVPGSTKIRGMSVLAGLGLTFTVLFCCLFIDERDPTTEGPPDEKLRSMTGKVKYIFRSLFRLPPQVLNVCKVQFCSWVGWFSFLYYISTYVGEICTPCH